MRKSFKIRKCLFEISNDAIFGFLATFFGQETSELKKKVQEFENPSRKVSFSFKKLYFFVNFLIQNLEKIFDIIENSQSHIYNQVKEIEKKLPEDYDELEKLSTKVKIYEKKSGKNSKKCLKIDKNQKYYGVLHLF